MNVGNFIKEARTLYESKGTEESFKILFNVLFGETPKVIDLEQFLLKPSSSTYVRRAVVIADVISGDPLQLKGQTIFKNNDITTSASVSEVEIIRRKNKTYYKLLLFIGYDDAFPTITGTFNITGNTKNLNYVSEGDSVITVDSTLGFPQSGTIYSGNNKITYIDKSINQFFGCSGVTSGIATASTIYSDETYYGYAEGDKSKKVEIRITGVISNYKPITTNSSISIGEQIKVKNIGTIIKNPQLPIQKTYKEIFANSWIYNTSSRYQIDSFSTPQITLKSNIDKSSLKVGDYIDILTRDSQTIINSNLEITSIFENQITIAEGFSLLPDLKYDIRRKIKNANASNVEFEYNPTTSDVQNVYDENNEHMYVASNSLPSYQISNSLFSYNASGVSGKNSITQLYSTITFSERVSFLTGSEIYYTASDTPISGLSEGLYYVEVVSGTNNQQIKLYLSKSLVGTENYVSFGTLTDGTHNFILDSQKQKVLSPQKILRKFPISNNIGDGKSDLTLPGAVGILVNGVEIFNYKSDKKIYYGPLESVNVLSGGTGYDVINPPLLSLSSGSALVQPVISGSVEKIYVDPQDFDIDVIVSVALTGGNGTDATFEPIVERKRREIAFDAREISNGGGISTTFETITFLSDHNLYDGQPILYRQGGNSPLGIGTYYGSDANTGRTLKNESLYYSKFISNNTIQLYESFEDFKSGINTVGFTTIGTSGIHKFATEPKNTLSEIKIINQGSGYTNRKLRVVPTGISTINHTISFSNHGFKDGELIVYSSTGNLISGLTTTNQYYVLKVDNDTFKLSNAGIGGTVRTNYLRKNYISLGSTGSGYHVFNYPDIYLKVEYSAVGFGSTQITGVIDATPTIRGEIVDVYVYEKGSDYGSTILNYHKKPSISIKNGKDAQLKANIINGSIQDVFVQYGGTEYYSTPDIIVTGTGTGAALRAIVVNNKITDVIVVNPGTGYSTANTTISVIPAGKNVLLDPQVRSITVKKNVLYKDIDDTSLEAVDLVTSSYNNLQYGVFSYSQTLQSEFKRYEGQSQFFDDGTIHSPIIGWAYDGNPIYGPYGYENPKDNSTLKKLVSGYTLNTANILNRPSGFNSGFFVEDYKFTNSGDLDEYNGRYCITPEFPNGVYAYFATSIIDDENNVVGSFPYFIGDRYRSKFIAENKTLNQSFDFNNSNLVRNTFPYKVNDNYADNDFIIESNEIVNQTAVVESVTFGSIDSFDIINSGYNYKIGNTLQFNEENTNGGGLIAQVSEIKGEEISNLQTSITSYNDAIFTWKNGNQVEVKVSPKHNFENLDYVNISGFSTSLSSLNGFQQIGVTSYTSVIIQEIPSYSAAGIVTDVYVSNIPENISIGSSLTIESERLSVLNIFPVQNVLRVVRETTGAAHTATTPIYFNTDTFIVNKSVDYFESKINDLIYFNANQSIGVGTTSGIDVKVINNIGVQTNNLISIPTQSIYLPNHSFKTNQAVTFTKPSSASAISVANTEGSTAFNLPSSGDSQTVYIIKKSVDHIGIVTQIGLTTSTSGLFFINNGSNDYQYSLQSNFTQVKGDIEKIVTQVSVSTSHELISGDIINLSVKPNLSVGIGTSTAVRLKYNQAYNKLLINSLSLTGSNVSGVGSASEFSYTYPTRVVTLDTAVGIAWTSSAISPTATRNAQQIYDYIWDNYTQFDIDGDGVVSYNDGVLITRYLFGLASFPNIATGITFPQNAIRTTHATCYARCGIVSSYFDVDGSGLVQPLGDGLLIARFASAPGDISPGALGFNVAPAVKNYGNVLYIPNHGLETGNKIFLDYFVNNKKEYFVYKIDKDTINICETYLDSISNPPLIVNNFSFTTATFAQINPAIPTIKNNNLVFNLTDSSLSGYKFKIFYDQEFKDEFISIGSTSTFSVSGLGTVGISTNASLTINYSEGLPTQLFYALEKSGYISTADKEVQNYSQINFIDSYYNGSYNISGVGTTTFSISLTKSPEKNYYTQSDCDSLEYTTTSASASGGVSKVRTISAGSNFKKLPVFEGIDSISGTGAYIIPKSDYVGQINEIRILNEGFEYSSDKTLRPEASIPKFLTIENSKTIEEVNVTYGGKNYISAPDIILVNSDTGEKIDSGLILANLSANVITSVNVIIEPKGLPENPVTMKVINNSNGVGISSIQSSSSGIVTCSLLSPSSGFSVEPFAVGDKIYVEGIEKYGTEGDGLNSENYGYQFFTVSSYTASTSSTPAVVRFNLSGLTTNPGIAKTLDNNYGRIINYSDYPSFNFNQVFSNFIIGESLEIKEQSNFIEKDLKISESNNNYIKTSGSYELEKGQIIRGTQSGSIATINEVKESTGQFIIDYSSVQNIGWSDNIGKLDEDTQVISDNDYYQNLSYTVKSNQEWIDIVSPVNGILHPSGLKNFADTQIIQNVGVGTTNVEEYVNSYYNIIDENRVDTINNFDFVQDFDVNQTKNISRFVKLQNKRLSNYFECRTNRVLEIDDISSEFSTSDQALDLDTSAKIVDIISSRKYNKYLVQISSKDYSQSQFNEVIVLNDNSNIITLEKGTISVGSSIETGYISNSIGDVYGYIDDSTGDYYLKFTPREGYNTSYNIKYLNTTFTNYTSGVGTASIGFINLTGTTSTVSSGSTAILLESSAAVIESIHSEIHLIDNVTNEMNYVELFVDHNGTDTNISEFYFDSEDGMSSNFIGSFGASISPSGILSLTCTNTSTNSITIRSKNIGFGTTASGSGIGTYRFKQPAQLEGYENTVKYDSLYTNVSSASTIISYQSTQFNAVKSVLKVSIGQTSALHQVMLISDSNNVYTTQYPFLSIGSTSGIGTFGGEISGSTVSLKFYPDAGFSGTFEILSFNQSFYRENDYVNIAPNLEYSNVLESVGVSKYFAINDDDINTLQFDLKYNGVPIFMKTFDPSNSLVLEPSTGNFNISNHFFSTGEELIYRPNSTFIGVAATSVGIGSTLNYVGVVTNLLPPVVYAIKINNDKFKIATRKEYAAAGIAVTFTSVGLGNAHELEMVKKNEKSIITIDNIIQSPISYSLLNYTVNNGTSIGAATTFFALSGISSILIGDILKIDNEYMKVENVGFGTTYSGPISFAGTFPLVGVKRGFVGSSATSHSNSGIASVYRGSFNISKSAIYFTYPPQGSLEDQLLVDFDELPEAKSYFNGRVFLRKDYTSNVVYDNISENFTGIGQTYKLTVGGGNTIGLGTIGGNGIVLINGIYQTPTTENNINNNFRIFEDTVVGVSSIVFSGITSTNGSLIVSESDINLNQLPRGGVIVSLGSTPGLGYAPLVGASVTSIISGGIITSIGIGTTGNWGSGYTNPVSVAVTDSTGNGSIISANVGAGGTLSFTIVNGGSGYTNPTINVSAPSYSNLTVIGVSRLGIGTTTSCGTGLLVNVDVGACSTTGIGSTLFEVTNFEIVRNGYGFKPGDVVKVVGLVTAYGLSSPISEFKLTVVDTFTDSFSAWQFGELDYIDSIKNLQDGLRVRFPLYYNSQLLSFEKNSKDQDSQLIDFNTLLVIFINGILQQPGVAYQFNGGTSFTFTEPPKVEDNISIYFYRGSSLDSEYITVFETLKPGDDIQILSNNLLSGITTTQNSRVISGIVTSDIIETSPYGFQGIDASNFKPLNWTKQKVDKVIDGELISKSRDSIEPQIYPTAKIIKDLTSTDGTIYVDNSEFFNYESEITPDFNALIISGTPDPVSAAVTAVVSIAGTIQSLSINNAGGGYVGASINVSISSPMRIGVGIGTTANASISIVNGSLSAVTINNPGFGYTTSNPPQVLVPLPDPTYENITNITAVAGKSGNLTGIGTTVGIGTDLALRFTAQNFDSLVPSLSIGDYIFVYDTIVGNGVTSIINSNTDVIGIGTICVDNIYRISAISAGVVTCNIHSQTSIVGIATTGDNVGKFSWGKLSSLTRSLTPISIGISGFTVNSGLTTFPTIQRRNYGLRNTGAIKKDL